MNAFRGRRVVMTGGGDVVGARVLERLVDGGAHVVLVGQDPGPSRRTEELVAEGRVRFRQTAPTEDRSSLRELFAGDDLLVLLGYVSPKTSAPSTRLVEEFALNVEPNLRLVDAGGDSLEHVTFASSVAVYGPQALLPAAESAALGPIMPFAVAKMAAEQSLRSVSSYRGVPTVILRYASVYGPGDDAPDSVAGLIRSAVQGSEIVMGVDARGELDYLHVDDAVEATIRAIALRADGTYNVGTGIATSTLEIAQLVVAASGTGVLKDTPPGRVPTTFRCDPELAARELGFRARRDLATTIAAEVARVRSERVTVGGLLDSGATA